MSSKDILKTRNYLINFICVIPLVYEFGLVYTLLHCCFHVAFSYENCQNEINALKERFELNRYSIQFTDRCMKEFLQTLYVTSAIQDTVNKKQLLVVLRFLGSQFSLLTKRLQSCIRTHLPCFLIRISFRSKTRLFSLFCFKDIKFKEISSHIVH